MSDQVEIREFDGDAEALERMAHTAWRDEYGIDSYPNLYKRDYLEYLMAGVDDPRMALGAYKGGEIVGFLLNLPRTMAMGDKEYRAALSCLLVVRKESFRQGTAQAMITEALKINDQLKFDFTLFYLETGHRSSKLFKKLAGTGFPIERVKRMHVIARVLDLPSIRASENVKSYEVAALRLIGADRPSAPRPEPRVREAGKKDTEAILALLNTHRDKVKLARVYEKEELVRELLHPPTARALVWDEDGAIKAVMAFVTVEHVGRIAVPWTWLNHVHWDALTLGERSAMTRSFLSLAADSGSAGVVEWSKHTYPTAALYLNRFVPYPRQVDMMAWRFRDDISLSGISDVYEVQI